IVGSSTCLYFFSRTLGFDRVFESRYARQITRIRDVLGRHEVGIIAAWSFFPLAPTDLICYVCGLLRLNFWTFLASVTIGEGAMSAIYIYGGDHLLRWM